MALRISLFSMPFASVGRSLVLGPSSSAVVDTRGAVVRDAFDGGIGDLQGNCHSRYRT